MKKSILIITSLCFFLISNFAFAQMPRPSGMPTISRWLDDENYLEIRREARESKVYKVNAKSGKAVLYDELSYRDEVNKNLPEGFSIDR